MSDVDDSAYAILHVRDQTDGSAKHSFRINQNPSSTEASVDTLKVRGETSANALGIYQFGTGNIAEFLDGNTVVTTIDQKGSVSGSATSTGSFGILEINGGQIASDGNDFGIGTTSPTSPGGFARTLQLSTDDDGASMTFTSDADGTARHFEVGNALNGRAMVWNRDDSSNGYIQFGTDATRRMLITKDGDVTISNTLYVSGNNSKLYVDGKVLIDNDLEVTGSISGSSTSTGSFGFVKTGTSGNVAVFVDSAIAD